jgi:type II secretory pathway predicted ATPase ExeA
VHTEVGDEMLRYYQHFGLQRDPFLDTSDPQFYLELPAVRRNLRRVLTGVEESRGLTVVIGPPGAGKTSLSTSVEQVLLSDEKVIIGKILDPTFENDVEFLLAIARVFGLNLKSRSSAVLKNALKNFFFDAVVVEKRTLVLLIDEAQNLTGSGLETLRLLLNFQIPQKKLLNLILFGQDELSQLIGDRENFNDRIDTYVRLEPLDAAASAALVEHRLTRAGKLPMVVVFASDALDRAIAAGGGLPRRLTNVVRSAMIEAADRGAEMVRIDHVVAALRSRGMKATMRTPLAAESVSGEVSVPPQKPAQARTLMARILAWFP